MTIRTVKLGGTDWGNEILYPADVNDSIEKLADNCSLTGSIYTGTGFNSSSVGSASDTHNHTLQLSIAQLKGINYLKVNLTLATNSYGQSGTVTTKTASGSLQIEKQETGGGGGGWSDVLAVTNITQSDSCTSESKTTQANVLTMTFLVTLTAGETAAGLDIKITSTCISSNDASYAGANITNKQVWFEGLN